MRVLKTLTGPGIAVALTIGLTASSQAAPLPTHFAAMKAAIGSDTLQVRWGGGWRGGGTGQEWASRRAA